MQTVIKRAGARRAALARIPLTTSPVLVPTYFIGLHTGYYPVGVFWVNGGAADPPPSFAFASTRIHDCYCRWLDIETSEGVYDWTRLDAFVEEAVSNGRRVMYTLHGTPTFRAPLADQAFKGPYNKFGECASPESLSSVSSFVSALVARYNTVNPSNLSGVKKIAAIETWNEPRFAQTRTGFWWGTAQQLVDLSKTVRAAAKALDASIQVYSPAFEDSTSMGAYLATASSDALDTGATLADALTFHPYLASASTYDPYVRLGNRTAKPLIGSSSQSIYALAAVQAAVGTSLPLEFTEWGFGTYASDPMLTGFLAMSERDRYTMVWRFLAASAALGVKSVYLYSYATLLAGDLKSDVNGAIRAVTDITNQLVGSTITSAHVLTSGQVTVTLSSGNTYTV